MYTSNQDTRQKNVKNVNLGAYLMYNIQASQSQGSACVIFHTYIFTPTFAVAHRGL